jgi:hypothetical protein
MNAVELYPIGEYPVEKKYHPKEIIEKSYDIQLCLEIPNP